MKPHPKETKVAICNRALLTGAAGALGSQLRKVGHQLASELRLSDRLPFSSLASHERDFPLDLANLESLIEATHGCEAIIHLGGQGLEASWSTVLHSNIVGTYNVYEAARKNGVKRVIYASSVHAVGFYERYTTIDASFPTRPDSLYGVSKTFGENLARYYHDKFGIESVCVRIGSCFPEPSDRRHLITWLSYRDLCHFVERALIADCVGCMIAMPTSRNSMSFWDDKAASILGYTPQDSADSYRETILAKTPKGNATDPAVRFQGGSFAAAGHFDDFN
jgi:uronate dehydrogenase